ncbi:MAG: nicotinate-nucleotide adenylyltransferase [Cyanobacteria bacterium SW_12_48_29]|nr:MAG: nicotinate-nucleotide adenylyltransferase [Cyanobacteria bacterium QH_3_48_40]PSO85964.1 MAG: nicotinate-nucleotide adenylyltransferase [Cyanobacteria bacterium QS_5_48_63]PSO90571.1 MAG: nicotinate-nucleotide adenylyltransferase [Cyanobacteria bacterium QS_3_48_167]PSP06786.1 MAG: nicotinate-nucleotide adenylyltransferase [Cyanobacteria bacterium SW_12_48_29]PSP07293.1 MAG: nicotinate-nucleotide adenylyltransferase [Cyanobacteria bacterium SW_7_48_12]PSP15954.1 MAG: nicotinate-nucleot
MTNDKQQVTKIALFGTSADPPTAGHKAILQWLSYYYDWVAVWASDNPFKFHQTPLEHRTRMLRLLISNIETPENNIGLHQSLSSPRTLETVEKATEIWGTQVAYTLVIGSDLVSQIPRWYASQKLLQSVQLLVIPRPGYPIEKGELEELWRLGGQCAIAHIEPPAVSSTTYRKQGNSEAVTPPIEDYIHQEQLYACQDAAATQ